ncbi:5'-3' exonuclease [Bacillus cereus]|uniref:5'-3' exonuclease n=1 Tax=Bacillus TaxID=1386 RepID=UPI0008FE9962|nr:MULTISPECIES: 5'-3' exonuclease H3TH domain-containing protein [Bacillus]UBR29110.1 5'-3' exonuclease [Bacillus sp. SD-4]AXO92356.1 5'-3' exonuclease [Bacillus anthracis]MBE3644423.1 5'-3' exonuclease [Bacillus anthracis]MDA1756411.1 5'-3' exonuclease [Bacillus cereus]MDA2122700.1 5'-3' exonuclease [Bacillus cereus]
MKKVLLVDGMALLFRAFYATSVYGQFMKRQDGTPTNGIHGYMKHLLTAMQAIEPTHIVTCWDMGSTTFRTESFSNYKANRAAPPEELIPQFDLVQEMTAKLTIPVIGMKGYEADDCIGTLAKQYCNEAEVYILTGDTDLLQLVDKSVTVMLLRKGIGNYEYYTPEKIMEEKGVEPWQIVHAKAFMGDTSDNYPGVKGIGEKTAYKLIQEHGTVTTVLENVASLTKAQRTKIESDLENLNISLQLAQIHCEVPISCSLEEGLHTIDEEKLRFVCEEMNWGRPEILINML